MSPNTMLPTTENVTLKDGVIASISARMAFDGFYGEVLSAEEDGSGQKIMKLSVSVDGEIVAAAEAGYLDYSRGGHLAVLNVSVDDSWRRKGIASRIYDYIETQYGDQVLPYPGNEGGAIQHFWHERLKDNPDLLEQVKEDIGEVQRESPPAFEM